MKHNLFIDGVWQAGESWSENTNPSKPSDVIGLYASGGVEHARAGLKAAHAAFPEWKAALPLMRHNVLMAVSQYLTANSTEFGTLLSREQGKIVNDGIGEVLRAAQCFSYFAGETLRGSGETLRGLRPGFSVTTHREPVGVVAVITPWNFPIAIPAWKIAAALAYGNTVVFKPAELTPAMAWVLTEGIAKALSQAGAPAGVFNLANGRGAVLGNTLIEGADALTFTGSTAVGRGILLHAAKFMKKVQLELGGKNPFIVAEDADLDLAVDCALDGSFFQTGQRCTASSRLIVDRKILPEFVDRLQAKMFALKVGDALDPETKIGPAASEAQRDSVQSYIRIGKEEGATALEHPIIQAMPNQGYFLAPTLFVDTTNDMRINREEIFGPVASVIAADDLDHAISLANDTDYGLSAGICTTSLSKAEAFRAASKSGLTMVNAPTAGLDFHVPFGGRGASGFGGKEQGSAAIDFFTEYKTSYLNHGIT